MNYCYEATQKLDKDFNELMIMLAKENIGDITNMNIDDLRGIQQLFKLKDSYIACLKAYAEKLEKLEEKLNRIEEMLKNK